MKSFFLISLGNANIFFLLLCIISTFSTGKKVRKGSRTGSNFSLKSSSSVRFGKIEVRDSPKFINGTTQL